MTQRLETDSLKSNVCNGNRYYQRQQLRYDIAPFGSPQFLFSFPALQPLLSVICGNSKTCTVTISFYRIPSRQ